MPYRPLYQIAQEIRNDWSKQGKGINYAAKPYLEAMFALDKMTDKYGADDAKGIVIYFLSNASTWRGEVAKRIKAELNAMYKNAIKKPLAEAKVEMLLKLLEKEAKGVKFELKKKQLSEATRTSLSPYQVGEQVFRALFLGCKGEYSTNTSYSYGETLTFPDGTTERGYTTDSYNLTCKKPNLAFDWFPPQMKKAIELLMDLDKAAGKNSVFEIAKIYVTQPKGISSNKLGPCNVSINLGTGHSNDALWISSGSLSISKPGELRGAISKLKNSLKRKCKMSPFMAARIFFKNWIYLRDFAKVTNINQASRNSDIGYGSQASTKVFHTIHNAYDFTAFVKAYGIDTLKKAIEGTYAAGKFIKKIEDNGIVTTDESWVDTYD